MTEPDNNRTEETQQKDNNKKTVKTVVITVICTLLFIIILLLVILLGLKKCSKDNSGFPSNSGSFNSSIKYDYDVVSLNDKFKRIVKGYMDGPGGMDSDSITEVKAISYIDNYNDGYFSLNISVISENNKLFIYKAHKAYYPIDKSGFDNLISYLLLDSTPDVFIDGDGETEFSCNLYIPTEEVITTDKKCKYVISNNIAGTSKYFDGFYFESNQYNVYCHQKYNDSIDPFTKQADMVININHPLYGYYQSLSI